MRASSSAPAKLSFIESGTGSVLAMTPDMISLVANSEALQMVRDFPHNVVEVRCDSLDCYKAALDIHECRWLVQAKHILYKEFVYCHAWNEEKIPFRVRRSDDDP
jgi:hypothetical protein